MRTTTLTSVSQKNGGIPTNEKALNQDDDVMTPYPNYAQGGIVETGQQNYDDGGIVHYDPKMKDDLTQGASDQVAPVSVQPQPDYKLTMDDINAINTNPLTDPSAILKSMPPSQVAPVQVPQNSDVPRGTPQGNGSPIKLPGIPDNSSSDLDAYFKNRLAQTDKYGPNDQMALQNKLLADRNSWQSKLGNAGTSFADALMQGVAGSGNPGFNDKFRAEQNRQDEMQIGGMKSAHEQTIADLKNQMELDAQNPTSSVSKAAQKSYSQILQKMGATPEQIAKIPAAMLPGIASGNIALTEALARIAEAKRAHDSDIDIKRIALVQTEQTHKIEAAKKYADMGIMGRAMNSDAADVLKNEMDGGGGSTAAPKSGWKYVGKVGQ